jgi:hypothetical protein
MGDDSVGAHLVIISFNVQDTELVPGFWITPEGT